MLKVSGYKNQFSMQVQEPWFSFIGEPDIRKRKTVEGRVGPISKHIELVGKEGRIYSDDRHLYAKVKFIRHYDTLEDYLQAEGWMNAAPHAISYMDALEKYSQVTTVNLNNGKSNVGNVNTAGNTGNTGNIGNVEDRIQVFGPIRIRTEGGINAIHLELVSPIINNEKSNIKTNVGNVNTVGNVGNVGTVSTVGNAGSVSTITTTTTNIPSASPPKTSRISFSNEMIKK